MTVIRRATTSPPDQSTGVAPGPGVVLPDGLRPGGIRSSAAEDPHLRTALVAVVETARCCVGGCAEATVTAVVDGKPVTLAATEAFVVELDCFQYEIGEGPCIDAVRVGRTVRAEFLTDGARYPIFGPRALTVDVVGTLSEPLESEGTVLGSINLFGRTSDALDGGTLRPARLLATQASAAVAAAVVRDDLRRKVAQLEQALESRDVIAQAKGILMLQSGVGPDEAFSLLVKASQRENRKLRDIAQEIADRTRQGGSGGRRSGGTG